jgi:Stress responsive A/B Barrel Domain
MIKHVVMWKLKDQAEGASKAENVTKMKKLLEGMEDGIPSIRDLEVGINIPSHDATHDIMLSTEFRTMVELDAYRKHPDHLKVAEFIKKVVEHRSAVDFIV